jgi:Ala-tRNA(Pro) deacylase
MPIPRHISEFLDTHRVSYQSWHHPLSYTAQGTAHAQHISGKELAKVVMVMADGRLVMAVLPGSHRLDLDRFGTILGSGPARLATEEEFGHVFPDCEVGAMPPFGNLYDIEVWIDSLLRDHPNIVFNAGTHEDTIQMSFPDFVKLVQPKEGSFSVLRH